MAEGLNRVMLLGNLGADPELRFTQGGQAVLSLRLATTESYLDKDKVRRERTDWHTVVVWGKRGEALSKILGKGSSLFVEGSLRTSSYDDRDGNKRYKTEIVANNVITSRNARLYLCHVKPFIVKIFEIMRIAKHLALFPSEDAALSAVKAAK